MANNKPGRPPRAGKRSSERVEIRLTKVERQSWARMAAEHGVTVSEWIRQCATAWAQHEQNRRLGLIRCEVRS